MLIVRTSDPCRSLQYLTEIGICKSLRQTIENSIKVNSILAFRRLCKVTLGTISAYRQTSTHTCRLWIIFLLSFFTPLRKNPPQCLKNMKRSKKTSPIIRFFLPSKAERKLRNLFCFNKSFVGRATTSVDSFSIYSEKGAKMERKVLG